MKKLLFILLLTTSAVNGFGQIHGFSYPNSVELFGLCEISFVLPVMYPNPYDPHTIRIYAEFTGPDNSSFTVNAFYYEDYTFQKHSTGYEIATHNPRLDGWRIRFTPNQVGTWTFIIRGFDADGSLNSSFMNVNHTFSCTSVSNADGFIYKANSRFLKRDAVRNGQRQFHSFFPVGPNIAWYDCLDYCSFQQPTGIYFYEDHIDSLYNKANYMRIWINRYQYLSLYGPEYTQPENGLPKVYFDSIVNQKDSAELDDIVDYAAQHDIAIMFSFFNQNDFMTQNKPCSPSDWVKNPFHTILQLENPCDFFTDPEAISITKNLIRYIISRWGYATNIMCWELWNEVNFVTDECSENEQVIDDIVNWHDNMAVYIASIDPYRHIITSSSSFKTIDDYLYSNVFLNLDINQQHNYQDIQRAKTKYQPSFSVFLRTRQGHNKYQNEPFFMGEFGYSHSHHPYTDEKDPYGIALHNALWSSLFSASIGPASFWWWTCLDSCGLYNRFTPLLNFCRVLPRLSETFTEKVTKEEDNGWVRFPNGIATYYMINATDDTIMGWCQDTAFAYQSLRWLTDSVRLKEDALYVPNNNGTIDTVILPAYYFVDSAVFDPNGYVYTLDPMKRPAPSSSDNTIAIPIANQAVGTRYTIRWYNSETGSAYAPTQNIYVQQDMAGDKFLSFEFPSFIRDTQHQVINNTFGDAVFIVRRYYPPKLYEKNTKQQAIYNNSVSLPSKQSKNQAS